MLVIVGLALVATRYWSHINVATRLLLVGAVTALLIGAGTAVHEKADKALARFRGFLWLASSATTALFAVVLSREQLGYSVRATLLSAALATAVESGTLWSWKSRPIQQFIFLVSLGTTVAASASNAFPHSSEGPVGLAAWAISLLYIIAGLRRLTPYALMTEAVGAVGILIGSVSIASGWESSGGPLFQLLSVAGLVALSQIPGLLRSRQDRGVIGVIGAIGAIETAPITLVYYAHDAGVLTGAITWLAGLSLVTIGTLRMSNSPILSKVAGGILLLGGAALTGMQSQDVAPIFGLVTSIGLVAIGTRPGQVLMSAFGSIGILINVTWGISWFFPGEAGAPLLILISGILVIAVAIWMTRIRGRFATELGLETRRHGHKAAPPKGG